MAGGQQIASSQGTLIGLGGANNVAATGSAGTAAAGTTAATESIPLRSRKVGSGTAAPFLIGQGSAVGTGTLVYQGLALISWSANTESDLAFYTVKHGLAPDQLFFESEDIFTTSYQIGGLAPGMTHYFGVSATDTSGNESSTTIVSKVY